MAHYWSLEFIISSAFFASSTVGDKVGISRTYMDYMEQGRNAPSLEELEKIDCALKSPIGSFFK